VEDVEPGAYFVTVAVYDAKTMQSIGQVNQSIMLPKAADDQDDEAHDVGPLVVRPPATQPVTRPAGRSGHAN
jgi:hypothetical protein